MNTREGVADLTQGACKVSTDLEKADVLNDFFCSVFIKESGRHESHTFR